ncbi:MAG: UrcA family protein [Alphaproteobacteria bacterium]|nr:UrcA family protein [Alphaproteobacteria bacterium]
MSRISRLALATLAVFVVATPMRAADWNRQEVTVSYADLDLSHPAGAAALLERLQAASQAVCGGMPNIRDLAAMARFKACRRQAMDRAVASVPAPLVAEIYGRPVHEAGESPRNLADSN